MQAERPQRGLLIAFEGIDGSGKSSHLRQLATFLREKGLSVIETREPTGGVHGQRIRSLFTKRELLSREEELELFLLDRKEHVECCINPALAADQIVLTDRYYFSTAAYQGAAGMDTAAIFAKNRFAPEPDLVLLLRVPPKEGVRRIREQRRERPNDFEQEEQLIKVDKLFASFPQQYIKHTDSTAERANVQAQIRQLVRELCQTRGFPCW